MKNKIVNRLLMIVVVISVLSMLSNGCKKDIGNDENASSLPGLKSGTLNRTILSPQSITDVTGRFYVDYDATPMNTAYICVRRQDDTSHPGNAISISPSYNPVNYTGYTPPTPLTSWQKGEFNDEINGSPVFQLYGTNGGMLMNSWFTTYEVIQGGGQNTVFEYKFSTPVSPWSTNSSVLWIQADLKLPWFANWDVNNNGAFPVGQLSYDIYLKDNSTNNALCIIVNVYDNRTPVPTEAVMTDSFTYFASTRFGGTKYSTPNQFSASWRNTTWSAFSFYRAEITRQNIINIATDINEKYSQNFSVNPDDYVLTSAGILQETFREQGDQVSMGSSFRDFSIYENY